MQVVQTMQNVFLRNDQIPGTCSTGYSEWKMSNKLQSVSSTPLPNYLLLTRASTVVTLSSSYMYGQVAVTVLYCRTVGQSKCLTLVKIKNMSICIQIDQLDIPCFIISLFTAQHVSNVSAAIFRSLRLTVDLFHTLYSSGSMCVGVTVWFGWGGVVSLCRLKHCWSGLEQTSSASVFTIYCSTCFEC